MMMRMVPKPMYMVVPFGDAPLERVFLGGRQVGIAAFACTPDAKPSFMRRGNPDQAGTTMTDAHVGLPGSSNDLDARAKVWSGAPQAYSL